MSVIWILLSFTAFSQKGAYAYYGLDSMVSHWLTLNSPNSYSYSYSACLKGQACPGVWTRHGDTLLLTSKYQKDRIGLKVVEYIGDGDAAQFDVVKNTKGDEFPTGVIFINGDSMNMFDPLEDDCKFPKGKVRSFWVEADGARSIVYTVKDPRTTRFAVTLNIDCWPSDYLPPESRIPSTNQTLR